MDSLIYGLCGIPVLVLEAVVKNSDSTICPTKFNNLGTLVHQIAMPHNVEK